jgi:hypothetical protein
VSKRKADRTSLAAGLLAIIALAVTAAVLWRWVSPAPEGPTLPVPPASLMTPGDPTAQAGEDFSAAERQHLDEILRGKSRDAHP